MAERSVVITKHDINVTLLALAGLPSYDLEIVPGDFSYTAPGWSRVQIYDNGTPVQARKGQAEPASIALTAHLRDVGGDADAYTLLDILHWDDRAGTAWDNAATSTADGESDLKTVDVAVTVDGAKFGLADKTLLFEKVTLRPGQVAFGDAGTVPITGQCISAIVPTVA